MALSLAASRADNFYYPPEWDPSKGTLNKFQGSHGALGDRARKLHEGILIIRFEMPFNVWCSGCNHLIGKGVRFNAEKKQIGMYHSSKIWSFVMKSPCCQTRIEVHTDPKNAEYVIVSGAKRKVEAFDAAEAGTAELDPEATARVRSDPFAKLEHGDEDKRHARETHQQISALRQDAEVKHRNDYEVNKQLRRQLRASKKEDKANDEQRERLGLPDHVKLLPETSMDTLAASAVHFGNQFKGNWKHARRSIADSSIFSPKAVLAAKGGTSAARQLAAGGSRGGLQQGVQTKRRRLDAAVKLRLTEPSKKGKA